MSQDNISHKKELLSILIETLQFALNAIFIFIIIGLLSYYLYAKYLKTTTELNTFALITGIIIAAAIIIMDAIIFHHNGKIMKSNERIFKYILKR